MSAKRVTRLAPSPTGALHLGNARTFLINWLMARQQGWKVILRIEDLDGPRIKRGADQLAMEDLKWLGIDWDEGPVYQSSRTENYALASMRLFKAGFTYPCICTRKDVESASSAPHAEDGSAVYPGTCRRRFQQVDQARRAGGREPTLRFNVDEKVVEFDDAFCGHQHFKMAKLGDFVIEKADRTHAYQLAVVVDDADMKITDVVRGDDLLDSTPRQILLYQALGLADRIPRFFHLPLVIGTDGRRLAKRHGDTRLATYRDAGVPAGRILAVLARWSGMDDLDENLSARDLVNRFDLARVPRGPIVFDPAQTPL